MGGNLIMRFVSPTKTKAQIAAIATDTLNQRISAIEQVLKNSASVLDGVKLEELVNFSVPLTSQQSPDQIEDGVLLSYKDGKLVEETNLNGGTF